MNPDLRILIQVQDLDQKIASLQKEITEIPSRIQALSEELERLRQDYDTRLHRNQELAKQRRTAEGEVDMMRSRLSKLRDQLMAVKTNKEYTAMLHEIQAAEDQIRAEEDKILDFMMEMETADSVLKAGKQDLDAQAREHESQIRKLEASVPELESEKMRLEAEKEGTQARVNGDLLGRYQRLVSARKGIALAEAKDELCSACHVRIRPQVLTELLRSDGIFSCDSCGRILFLREGA